MHAKSLESDKPLSTEPILKSLRDPLVRLFFLFLSWVLPKFTAVNTYFQSAHIVLHNVHERMKTLMLELLMAYMDNQWVKRYEYDLNNFDVENTSKFLKDSEMYLGAAVMNAMEDNNIRGKRDMCNYFYSHARKFLIKSAKELCQRYDFNDPLLQSVSFLDPKKALSLDTRKEFPSLIPFMNRVPRIKHFFQGSKQQAIDDEWRQLPLVKLPEDFPDTTNVTLFWNAVAEMKNGADEQLFKHLTQFVFHVLSLPHSNADTERLFSKMNLVKTKSRNRMLTENVCGNMLASQLANRSGGSSKLGVTDDMLKRMTKNNLYCKADVEDFSIIE